MVYPAEQNSSSMAVAGIARSQYAIVNTIGIPMGSTGSILNGTARGMGIHIGIKQAGGTGAQPTIVNVTGDNRRFRRKFVFTAEDVGELDLQFAELNMDAFTAFSGTKKAALGAWNAIPLGTNAPPQTNQICIINNFDTQDADTQAGDHRFYNEIYFLVTVTPTVGNKQEAAAIEWPYKGAPTPAGRLPWGTIVDKTIWGATEMIGTAVSTTYPLTSSTYVSDGTATPTFFLNYIPATDDTGSGIKVWKNTGSPNTNTALVPTTDFTVVPGNRAVKLNSTPNAGDIFSVWYEAVNLLI